MDPNVQAILEMVHGFYNAAWNRLVLVGGLMITVVGVVIPILITVYQRWSWKQDQDRLVQDVLANAVKHIDQRLATRPSAWEMLNSKIRDADKRQQITSHRIGALEHLLTKEYWAALDYIATAIELAIAVDSLTANELTWWADREIIPGACDRIELYSPGGPDLAELLNTISANDDDPLAHQVWQVVRTWEKRIEAAQQARIDLEQATGPADSQPQ